MTAPGDRPQAEPAISREMTRGEQAYYEWASATSGVDTTACDCGHDGMGVDWHFFECRGAANAARRKVAELFEQLGAIAATLGGAPITGLADEVRATLDLYDSQRREAAGTAAGQRPAFRRGWREGARWKADVVRELLARRDAGDEHAGAQLARFLAPGVDHVVRAVDGRVARGSDHD
jgi:hypothetical protein